MVTATTRLHRYIASEVGNCQSDGVNDYLETLDTIDELLSTEHVTRDLDVLSAMANGTRYKLLRLLVAADRELCVCDLKAMVDGTDSAISHALSRLREAGLVDRRKDGRWRKYRATNRAVALVTVLDGLDDMD